MSNSESKKYVYGALFIAIVTALTYINLPWSPTGGLVHLGYVALFPIAIVYGKKYGMIAGAIGMALFDVLSQWFMWAPATFIIVGLVGYTVGSIADGGSSPRRNVIAMLVGSLISISGYFVFNAFIMGFGVPSAVLSIAGDSFKLVFSLVVTMFTVPAVQRAKLLLSK